MPHLLFPSCRGMGSNMVGGPPPCFFFFCLGPERRRAAISLAIGKQCTLGRPSEVSLFQSF